MTTLYYQYGDERLYTHPISVDVKEVKMLSLLLDYGVPEDYARSLCEALSYDDVRCTEFSAYYLREYGGPSAREDDIILKFCKGWIRMKAEDVNSARVEEGVLTLKAENVCSSCSCKRSVVMKERIIDTVLKLMRGAT